MWWILIFMICLLIGILLTRVNVHLTYAHIQKKQTCTIHIKIWYIQVYTLDVPMATINDQGVQVKEKKQTVTSTKQNRKRFSFVDLLIGFQHIQEWMTYLIRVHKQAQPIFKRITVHTLLWRTEFGIGDAPLTAQATGYIWAAKSGLIGTVSQYVRIVTPPSLSVSPLYQLNVAHTQFTCMFSVRVGHAIHAGITLLKHWRQRPQYVAKNE